MIPLYIASSDSALRDYAASLLARFPLQDVATLPAQLGLVLDDDGLSLRHSEQPQLGALQIDFVGGRFGHRRTQQAKEAVVQAVLGRKKTPPQVWDLTAGLGRDSFLLAQAGCQVTMFEQHPALAALLDDGLRRAALCDETAKISARMQVIYGDSLHVLQQQSAMVEVIYFDPMYPARDKQLKVKREMQWLKWLIGPAGDEAPAIAELAQRLSHKLVIKRPEYAQPLLARAPTSVVSTKSHRFECYVQA